MRLRHVCLPALAAPLRPLEITQSAITVRTATVVLRNIEIPAFVWAMNALESMGRELEDGRHHSLPGYRSTPRSVSAIGRASIPSGVRGAMS
jgi:hypothetical protein